MAEETDESEWQWFRRAVRDSLLRPRRSAATLAREHYGLAGVLVALLAGIALSLSVDVLVIAAKGLDPLDHLTRLLLDALLLGVRLAIVAALAAAAVAVVLRLLRQANVSIDQTFTAISFALTPLLVAPVLAAALALLPELLPVIGALALLLVLRLLYGLFTDLRPLAPLALTLAACAVVIAAVPLTLPDQVARITFTAVAYQPALAPPLDATPATGTTVQGEGYTITVPPRWRQVTLGLPGEIGRFETATDVLVIMRATGGGALVTPDSYAESVAIPWRRGLDGARMERAITRTRSLVLLEDTYTGAVDGRPELLRQFTAVVGTQGMALLFRYIEPDAAAARAESAAIAASWTVRGR